MRLIFRFLTEKLQSKILICKEVLAAECRIVVIIFYGIARAIGGFLIGVIYNFVAKKFGGIEMEIETA